MKTIGVEKVQLGHIGPITGMWRNIVADSLEVEINICSKCSKVEFYSTNGTVET